MIVYVAGSSRELERAERAMETVRAAGHTVAFDWVAMVREVGEANPRADDEARRQWAGLDLGALRRADLLWLLVREEFGGGSAVEFGFFLAVGGARIITSGGDPMVSVFLALADRHFATDEAAGEWLQKAGER